MRRALVVAIVVVLTPICYKTVNRGNADQPITPQHPRIMYLEKTLKTLEANQGMPLPASYLPPGVYRLTAGVIVVWKKNPATNKRYAVCYHIPRVQDTRTIFIDETPMRIAINRNPEKIDPNKTQYINKKEFDSIDELALKNEHMIQHWGDWILIKTKKGTIREYDALRGQA